MSISLKFIENKFDCLGRNFITPNLHSYGNKGKLLYQISSGYGGNLSDVNTIYGVTFLSVLGKELKNYNKGFFRSLSEAKQHIETVNNLYLKTKNGEYYEQNK